MVKDRHVLRLKCLCRIFRISADQIASSLPRKVRQDHVVNIWNLAYSAFQKEKEAVIRFLIAKGVPLFLASAAFEKVYELEETERLTIGLEFLYQLNQRVFERKVIVSSDIYKSLLLDMLGEPLEQDNAVIHHKAEVLLEEKARKEIIPPIVMFYSNDLTLQGIAMLVSLLEDSPEALGYQRICMATILFCPWVTDEEIAQTTERLGRKANQIIKAGRKSWDENK